MLQAVARTIRLQSLITIPELMEISKAKVKMASIIIITIIITITITTLLSAYYKFIEFNKNKI